MAVAIAVTYTQVLQHILGFGSYATVTMGTRVLHILDFIPFGADTIIVAFTSDINHQVTSFGYAGMSKIDIAWNINHLVLEPSEVVHNYYQDYIVDNLRVTASSKFFYYNK